jgi:ribosomal protein L17
MADTNTKKQKTRKPENQKTKKITDKLAPDYKQQGGGWNRNSELCPHK